MNAKGAGRARRAGAIISAAAAVLVGRAGSRPAAAATFIWDPSASVPPADGPGTWDALSTNPSWSVGAGNVAWQNSTASIAQFGSGTGAAATVNVDAAVLTGGLAFNATGGGDYTVASANGAYIQLGGANRSIAVAAGLSPTISAKLVATAGLNLTGPGTLTLSGAGDSLAGLINVNSGTLVLANTENVGGTLNVSAGAAVVHAANAVIGTSVINAGSITVNAGQAVSFANTSPVFNQVGGSLTVNGSLTLGGGSFYDLGGTITGTVTMTGGGVYFGPGATSGTFAFTNGSSGLFATVYAYNGQTTVPAGATVSAHPTAGPAQLTVMQATNAGTLSVTSANGSYGYLTLPSAFTNVGTVTMGQDGTPSMPANLGNGTSTSTFTNGVGGTVNVQTDATIGGTFVNAGGIVNVAAGHTLSFASGNGNAFNQAAGTLNISGTLAVGGSNGFYDLGGTINGTVSLTGGGVYLGPSAAAATFAFGDATNTSGVTANVYGANGQTTIPAGVTVSVRPAGGPANLYVGPSTNAGTLSLTSANGSYGYITVPSAFTNVGTLTLAQAGTPSFPANLGMGSGSSTFTNGVGGTVNLQTDATTNGTFANAGGTVNIAAGHTLSFGSGSGTFNQSAGTLNVNGTLSLGSSGSFYDLGGAINGAVTMAGGGAVYLGPQAASATFAFTNGSNGVYANVYGVNGQSTIPSGVTVNVASAGYSTQLYVGPTANAGTLSLTSANGGYGYVTLPSAFTNVGTITLAQAGPPSYPANLGMGSGSSTFTNGVGGTVNLQTDATFGGTFVNVGGIVNVAAGHTLSFLQGTAVFNQSAGTLNVNGTLSLGSSGSFYDLGGTINGTVSMTGGSVYLGPQAAAATFAFTNGSSGVFANVYGINGQASVPAGMTVTVTPTSGSAQLYVGPATNAGTLSLTTANGSYGYVTLPSAFTNVGTITLAQAGTPPYPVNFGNGSSNSTFTNGVGGTVNFQTDATISGTFANAGGMVNVAAGHTLSFGSGTAVFNQSAGALNVNGTLSLGSSGSFYDLGGTINGTVSMTGGSLYVGPQAAAATFAFTNGSSGVFANVYGTNGQTTVPSGVTVTVHPTAGSAQLYVGPATNAGTLSLTSANGSYGYVTLPSAFTNVGTLTLAQDGTPQFPANLGNGSSNSTFTNGVGGTVNLQTDATIAGTFANAGGVLNIAAGHTLSFGLGSSAVFNQSAGTLNVNGTLSLGSSGSFYDLGGTINGAVSMTGGSVYVGPQAAAATFAFTNGSSGAFANIYGANGQASVPAGVTLTVHPSAGSAQLYVGPAANAGTLSLTTANGSYGYVTLPSSFTNVGTLTLAQDGTPQFPANLGNGSSNSTFTNGVGGTVNLQTDATTNGTFANAGGTVTIAAGHTLSFGSGSSAVFNQSAGTLNVNGKLSLGSSGSFYDLGGTINGAISMTGGSVYLGPQAAAATFAFTNGSSGLFANVYGTNGQTTVPSGVTVAVAPTGGTAQLYVGPTANAGTLSLTAANGSYGSLTLPSTFFNSGTITLASNGTPAFPLAVNGALTNGVGGQLNVRAPTAFASTLTNAGGTIVAAAPITFGSASASYVQTGGTLAVQGPGFNLSSQSAGLSLSGGEVALAAGTVALPNALITKLVTWPAAAASSATALISSPATNGTQLAARLDMAGGCTFALGYAGGTLTVSAVVDDGTLTKTGPGTLVLSGSNTYAGRTEISAGTLTLAAGGSLASPLVDVASGATFNALAPLPNTTIQGDGTVNFGSPAPGGGPAVVKVASLTVAAGQTTTVAPPAPGGAVTVLDAGALALAGPPGAATAKLDLTGNALVVGSTTLADVTADVAQGFAGGTWAGTGGVVSATAADDAAHLTAVGVIANDASGTPLYDATHPFDGDVPAASAVLVAYTYYGDANLDGTVSAADYTRVDAGYVDHLTGWFNGDVNYDGVVDGSDYTLMDNAFNQQSAASAAAAVASPAALVETAVPEPASAALLAAGVAAMLGRRGHRRL